MIPLRIQNFLNDLHAESLRQEQEISSEYMKNIYSTFPSDPEGAKNRVDEVMLDKFIALDQDKAQFIYSLLLAKNATTVVEAGTSFGVSTIYLALAVHRNLEKLGSRVEGKPKVIATEKEASKAAKARQIWSECGQEVEKYVELREGDLEETLKGDLGLAEGQTVDMLLLDIWPYVALPALKLIIPHFKPGSIVITDNTISSATGYKDLISTLRDPKGPWISVTLPYKGGLEMSVFNPQS